MKAVFGRYGKFAFASFGAASAAVVVAKCSSRFEDSSSEDLRNKDKFGRVHVVPPDFAPVQVWDSNWDRSDPRFLKRKVWEDTDKNLTTSKDDNLNFLKRGASKNQAKDETIKYPTARRNIFLIRHGQYDSCPEDEKDHILTKTGEEQAAFLGKRMANSGIKFTSVTSSGMPRAIQTASIMLKQMKEKYPKLELKVQDPILNEGPPCIPEPPYRNKQLWDPDFNEFYAEGARIEAAFRRYFHRADVDQKEDSFEIIVCHANVIRYFVVRALQFPPEGWLRIGLDHSSMTRISLLPDGDVVLRGLGDSGHLPPDKTTA